MRRSPHPTPGPSRRAVLASGPVLLLAAACTADEPAPSPAPVDPDDALRTAAAQREVALLQEYDAVLAARSGLAPRLAPVRAEHAEHLQALLGARPSTTATALPSAGSPPPDDATALARLAAAERAAGDAHAADCLAASRRLAPVLASLSASELSHQVVLS